MLLHNLTGNFSKYAITEPTQIYLGDILRDVCTSIDKKIVLFIFLILTFYIIENFMMPISEMALLTEMKKYASVIKPMFSMGRSLFETFSLASSVFLLLIAYYQYKITLGYYVWIGMLALVVFLSVAVRVVENIKKKKK